MRQYRVNEQILSIGYIYYMDTYNCTYIYHICIFNFTTNNIHIKKHTPRTQFLRNKRGVSNKRNYTVCFIRKIFIRQ